MAEFFVSLPKEAYAIIGTILGALIALTGAIFSALVQPMFARKLEEKKLNATRQDTKNTNTINRVTQLATDIASATHSMNWLTWSSIRGVITKIKIETYDAEMHVVLPKVSAAVVAVAALDEKLGELAVEIFDQISRLDADIGEACLSFKIDPEQTKRRLNDIAPLVYELDQKTLRKLAAATRQQISKSSGVSVSVAVDT